jgi:hypothetical protein
MKDHVSEIALKRREEREHYLTQPCAWCFMAFEGEESMDMENDNGDIYRFHKDCFREFLKKS